MSQDNGIDIKSLEKTAARHLRIFKRHTLSHKYLTIIIIIIRNASNNYNFLKRK